jgi:hypothetical protein
MIAYHMYIDNNIENICWEEYKYIIMMMINLFAYNRFLGNDLNAHLRR